MINYIPINLYDSDKLMRTTILQLVSIFNVGYIIANYILWDFIQMVHGSVGVESLNQNSVNKLVSSLVGEFLLYKDSENNPYIMKAAFDKNYIYIFLIDKCD